MLGKETAFEQLMDKTVRTAGGPPQLGVRWAQWLMARQRHDEALDILQYSQERHPASPHVAMALVTLLDQTGQGSDAIRVTRHFLSRLQARHHAFQCAQCGFLAREIEWKCPQCHHWDTMEPM